MPESPDAHEPFEAEGLTLLVHRCLVGERLRFHFGSFGWCEASLGVDRGSGPG
jgi:hypothetical protein